jgi:hypothetical protein
MEIDKDLLRLARAVAEAHSALQGARVSHSPNPAGIARLQKALNRKMRALTDYSEAHPSTKKTSQG